MKKSLWISLLFVVFTTASAQAEEHNKPELFPKKQADHSVASRPEQVELLEPKALSVVTGKQVTLKWKPATTATHYKVQVATDANFKWLVSENNNVTETKFEVSGLEANKHYFWRVYSVKADNEPGWTSSFSQMSSFETK